MTEYTHAKRRISSTARIIESSPSEPGTGALQTELITTIDLPTSTIKTIRKTTADKQRPTSESVVPLRPLTQSDIYILADMLANLTPTPALKNDLLTSSFYTDIYLSSNMGAFDVPPYAPPFVRGFYLFSSMIIPFQFVDAEETRMGPTHGREIATAYYKNNSWAVRECKHLCRQILILPGLPLTPLIVGAALLGLSRMT